MLCFTFGNSGANANEELKSEKPFDFDKILANTSKIK